MKIDESRDGNTLVVTLSGKLDTVTSTDLQDFLHDKVSSGEVTIHLNMSDVSYVSSSGLRVLLMYQKRLKPLGGALVLVGVLDTVKQVFDISGFTQLFKFQ